MNGSREGGGGYEQDDENVTWQTQQYTIHQEGGNGIITKNRLDLAAAINGVEDMTLQLVEREGT